MNKRIYLMLALGLLANGLSGCSFLFGNEGYFRSRSLDYQEAKQHKSLELPEGTQVVARPEIYPIPDIAPGEYYVPAEIDEIPRPESLLSVVQDAGLEMRTDGDLNWLVADRKFGELWDDMGLFFKASGIEVESANLENKTITTAWLQPKQKEAEGFWDSFVEFFSLDNTVNLREKFRVSIEEGDRLDQYEVHVAHVRVDTSDEDLPEADDIGWQRDNDEESLVTAMYDEIISYLSDDEVRFRRSSLFSQNLTSQSTHLMTRDGNGFPVLVIQQDFNRAWIAVGESLDKSDLKVEDRNRSVGLFFVIYGEDEDGDDMVYQLKLNRAENGIQVAVQIDDEQIAPVEISDLILGKIEENL